jgi:UDP-3-O-[3-hydroxymyristoyl] N-acetylglucosamine deacetylase
MDGMSDVFAAPAARVGRARGDLPTMSVQAPCQHTLLSSICCTGIGLHSGRPANLTIHPAEPNTGIVFLRRDLGQAVPALYDRVLETRLSTVIGIAPDCRVGTIEHLLAALAGAGIDNARIEIDGPELPILDGSADPFIFLIDCAGIAPQAALRRVIDVLRPVRVEHDGAWAELRPHAPGATGLELALSIEFDAAAIGRQSFALTLTPESFRRELAGARTFTLASEIERLRAAGLGLGGSLDNALVVDGDQVLNPGGLRMEGEFVRHKLLDAVGDLALAGHNLRGRFVAHRTGHALNNRLLHALFADRANWRLESELAPGWLSAA